MSDETTNESNDEGKENTPDTPKPDKPISAVKEARAILDEIKKEKEELREENDRREEMFAKEMLGGKSDAGQVPEKPKEETPLEYRDRIDKEIGEGKHND